MNPRLVWENVINNWFLNKEDTPPFNQYHFNTFKLNAFLIKVAKDLGVNVFEDDITSVNLSSSNDIVSVSGVAAEYKYDFYIDSTGFKRLLIGKVGGVWESFGEHLKMNSAVVFPTEDQDNYTLWTLSKAMNAGWMFRLPVWGRHGNGYIFDDSYISVEEAKEEVRTLFGKDIEFGKEFKFDPGKIDRAWINNCVAIGLSGSFVEPLEASSIGTSIQQSFLLMQRLANYTQETIDSYNKSFNDIMYNIRDFLFLHYMTGRSDTDFWRDVSNIKAPISLQKKLDVWKNKLPITEDFNDVSDYVLFREAHHIMVGYGVGLINPVEIKKEYDLYPKSVKDAADTVIKEQMSIDSTSNCHTHKEFLRVVREHL